MAKKDENLKRLKELSELLGREPDMSGSAADIAQRVAELEEELDDTDDAAGQDTSVSPENALTGHENEVVSAQPDTVIDTAALVTVVALVTLHTDALHATRDEPVAFVLPGTAFRVSAGVAAEMTEHGLARMQ
ncbi:DNA-packaging protein FI [Escherichia coli]|uniref:DNA-packaging protein FI n=1 Tax=Escherichia coli TaxID=562 RepID=UPI001E583ED8|nr:DNA-packaging protein FI [Escherichia coli]HAV8993225.1 DNA-packaging protein FI [Escherichia coli]HAV9027483.1 DNA-packaging protein FI [Escherichia coli]HAW2960910.1 DNA-packaging protein FI [Escherichia coli]HAW4017890.1 DNA-packaging protein FI [Escherichia coli]